MKEIYIIYKFVIISVFRVDFLDGKQNMSEYDSARFIEFSI